MQRRPKRLLDKVRDLSARFHKYGHVIGLLEILRHAGGMAKNDIACHSERSEESQQYACQNTLP